MAYSPAVITFLELEMAKVNHQQSILAERVMELQSPAARNAVRARHAHLGQRGRELRALLNYAIKSKPPVEKL